MGKRENWCGILKKGGKQLGMVGKDKELQINERKVGKSKEVLERQVIVGKGGES